MILVDQGDNVIEGPGFNIFIVKSGEISIPDISILEGITRKTVIELAADYGLPLGQRRVPSEEVRNADEVFATSTAGGLIPVTKVDGEVVGDGRPGPMTMCLHEAYWELHRNACFTTPVEYCRTGQLYTRPNST